MWWSSSPVWCMILWQKTYSYEWIYQSTDNSFPWFWMARLHCGETPPKSVCNIMVCGYWVLILLMIIMKILVSMNQAQYREKVIVPFLSNLRRFCYARNLLHHTSMVLARHGHTARKLLHANFGITTSEEHTSHIFFIHMNLNHLILKFGVC